MILLVTRVYLPWKKQILSLAECERVLHGKRRIMNIVRKFVDRKLKGNFEINLVEDDISAELQEEEIAELQKQLEFRHNNI